MTLFTQMKSIAIHKKIKYTVGINKIIIVIYFQIL